MLFTSGCGAAPCPSRLDTDMHPDIADKRDALIALCQRYDVVRLEVFGSALRPADFDPAHSDIDFLVTFASPSRNSFAAFLDLAGGAPRPARRSHRTQSHRGQPQFHPPPPDSGRGGGGLWVSRPTGTPRCCSTCCLRRGTPVASWPAWTRRRSWPVGCTRVR